MDKATQEFWITQGIPASGKNTWAEQMVKDSHIPAYSWMIIDRDTIRLDYCKDGNIHNYKYTKAREKSVTEAQDGMVQDAIIDGLSVVVADTNLNPMVVEKWRHLSADFNLPMRVKQFDTPLQVCWKRNERRKDHVPGNVLVQMEKKRKQMMGEYVQDVEAEKDLPACIIVDIDGTLAHMKGRSAFEWHRVGEDTIDDMVRMHIQNVFFEVGIKVFIFSGRDSVCKPETEQWLADHRVPYDSLTMRPTMDEGVQDPKDYVVKMDMFKEHVQGKYIVDHVIDDRAQVCRMWESMGLKVWNVGGFLSEF